MVDYFNVVTNRADTKVVEKAKKRALESLLRAQPFKLPPEEYEY